jgi:tRNA-specific 2-thiouridylase
MKEVLVGLSGGIDSTMTALLLKDEGYRVIGVHFNLLGDQEAETNEKLERIKHKLGIDVIEYDATELFKKEVIGYFTSFHMQGLTPGPCSHCNPEVKWKLLSELADANKIENIATGHYVRIEKENGQSRIFKGIDSKKDQSYYLWRLDKHILIRALTPLGGYIKEDVKKLAAERGFSFLAKGKESSGLCFARGRDCEKLLNDYIPDLVDRIKPGIITDGIGRVIGSHKGYMYYTIGQKKGLNLNANDKLCVTEIDATNNLLVAGTWQSLYKNEFLIEDYIFIDMQELTKNKNIQAIIRGFGLNPAGNARLVRYSDTQIKVHLDNPAWAPAPGQPAVFYSGNKLLGGGIISRISF